MEAVQGYRSVRSVYDHLLFMAGRVSITVGVSAFREDGRVERTAVFEGRRVRMIDSRGKYSADGAHQNRSFDHVLVFRTASNLGASQRSTRLIEPRCAFT